MSGGYQGWFRHLRKLELPASESLAVPARRVNDCQTIAKIIEGFYVCVPAKARMAIGDVKGRLSGLLYPFAGRSAVTLQETPGKSSMGE
ncbi:hypothetical protein [Bradyrhizobium sp. USDA 4506]